jgi:hypothetical protein
MSLLTGLFSEVEHDALYKPDPRYKGVAKSLKMQASSWFVLNALRQFENTFENLITSGGTIKNAIEEMADEIVEKLE